MNTHPAHQSRLAQCCTRCIELIASCLRYIFCCYCVRECIARCEVGSDADSLTPHTSLNSRRCSINALWDELLSYEGEPLPPETYTSVVDTAFLEYGFLLGKVDNVVSGLTRILPLLTGINIPSYVGKLQRQSLFGKLNDIKQLMESTLDIYSRDYENSAKWIFYAKNSTSTPELADYLQTQGIELYESTVKTIMEQLTSIEVKTQKFLNDYKERFGPCPEPTHHAPEEEIQEVLKKLRTLRERMPIFCDDPLDLIHKIGSDKIQPETKAILESIYDSLDNQLGLLVKRLEILINCEIKFTAQIITSRPERKATVTPVEEDETEQQHALVRYHQPDDI